MIEFKEKDRYGMEDLVRIVALLRTPEEGCPWDIVQTHESIRQNFIEETYEAIEAIDLKDTELLREELGDVLLQVVFHCQMEAEKGSFDLDEVCDQVCKKLVFRHPHVFGQQTARDSAGALESWEKMKNREKGRETAADRLDSIPQSFPALMRAAKAQKRASAFGYEQKDRQKVLENLAQKAGQLQSGQTDENAVGELLFAAVAAARSLGVEPEEALTRASERFCEQVKRCEAETEKDGVCFEKLPENERGEYWKRVQKP